MRRLTLVAAALAGILLPAVAPVAASAMTHDGHPLAVTTPGMTYNGHEVTVITPGMTHN